ncbi:hypothetical protein NQ317_018318 [Molorchus minor]|uniref:Uncharacterized protein n=1 Tax=Molorchus minor TaxID=1323400 RepID=A0ABQ9JKI1_9CUCU|nr:hypothetical protein NQ317_018318 [Molorchus minor]
MYRIDICTAYSGFIYRAFRKTGSKGIYRQVRKAYIDRFERHISTGPGNRLRLFPKRSEPSRFFPNSPEA